MHAGTVPSPGRPCAHPVPGPQQMSMQWDHPGRHSPPGHTPNPLLHVPSAQRAEPERHSLVDAEEVAATVGASASEASELALAEGAGGSTTALGAEGDAQPTIAIAKA